MESLNSPVLEFNAFAEEPDGRFRDFSYTVYQATRDDGDGWRCSVVCRYVSDRGLTGYGLDDASAYEHGVGMVEASLPPGVRIVDKDGAEVQLPLPPNPMATYSLSEQQRKTRRRFEAVGEPDGLPDPVLRFRSFIVRSGEEAAEFDVAISRAIPDDEDRFVCYTLCPFMRSKPFAVSGPREGCCYARAIRTIEAFLSAGGWRIVDDSDRPVPIPLPVEARDVYRHCEAQWSSTLDAPSNAARIPPPVLEFNALARTRDGTVEDFHYAVSRVETSDDQSYLCYVYCPLIGPKPMPSYGADAQQAYDLAVELIGRMLTGRVEIVDRQGQAVALPTPKAKT